MPATPAATPVAHAGPGANVTAPPGPPPVGPMATPVTPGYSGQPGQSFPPMAPPVYATAPPAPAAVRAGRIRLRTHDGTEVIRAVSPTPVRRDTVPVGWTGEYGQGTVQMGDLLYRVISDEFLRPAVPLN